MTRASPLSFLHVKQIGGFLPFRAVWPETWISSPTGLPWAETPQSNEHPQSKNLKATPMASGHAVRMVWQAPSKAVDLKFVFSSIAPISRSVIVEDPALRF
jgi:hypothetical protein